jgi:hypothetical protein
MQDREAVRSRQGNLGQILPFACAEAALLNAPLTAGMA